MGFLVIILVVALVITAKQHRRHVALTEAKRCRGCGAAFAAHANFCGHCGRSL